MYILQNLNLLRFNFNKTNLYKINFKLYSTKNILNHNRKHLFKIRHLANNKIHYQYNLNAIKMYHENNKYSRTKQIIKFSIIHKK